MKLETCGKRDERIWFELGTGRETWREMRELALSRWNRWKEKDERAGERWRDMRRDEIAGYMSTGGERDRAWYWLREREEKELLTGGERGGEPKMR